MAMVPRLLSSSSLVIPMPLSEMIKVRASLSTVILMLKSSLSRPTFWSVKERKYNLSTASLALEINSLKKISRLVYTELIIKSNRRRDSVLNCVFSMIATPHNGIIILFMIISAEGSDSFGVRFPFDSITACGFPRSGCYQPRLLPPPPPEPPPPKPPKPPPPKPPPPK